MPIMLFLAGVALAILIAGGAALLLSLAVGLGSMATKQTRIVSPIFLVYLPVTVLGALAGCFGLGYVFITRVSENLVLWGPIVGMLVGTALGAFVGSILCVLIYWRRIRRRPGVPST